MVKHVPYKQAIITLENSHGERESFSVKYKTKRGLEKLEREHEQAMPDYYVVETKQKDSSDEEN